MRKNQSGFTLVEIAIVLVIIGLLLGGVLKGQELITQAKIKNIGNDLNGITAAVYSYQDRYKRMPGDDPGATRWSIITTAGNGDNSLGTCGYSTTDNATECRLFWAELRASGFVGGDASTLASAATQPLNSAGGITGVQQGALGLPGLVICTGSLPAKVAAAVDAQFDDGNLATGTMRGMLDTSPPTAVPATAPASGTANYEDNGSNLYVICKSF
jgi:prepilin-type N-terminal cleavage/methylation domain-containing protein